MGMKKTYTAAQQMNYRPCGCDERAKPPAWLLDKIADEKLTGGYKRYTGKGRNRKSNMCERCYTVKSVNGTCGCS